MSLQLKALYRQVSITLPGAGDAAATAAAVRDFVMIEEKRGATITPVATNTLTDLTYSVVDTVKCRREPLVQLRQADGEFFWVRGDDLAANSVCLNMHQQPERFAVSQRHAYRDFSQPPERPLLVVESEEPVELLVDLGVAAQCDIARAPPPPPVLLVVTGVAGAGKSELVRALEATIPERVVRPNVVATAPLPWAQTHIDIIPETDFAAHVAKGAFVYHAETRAHAAEQGSGAPEAQTLRWGLMRDEFDEVASGAKGAFVVVEEHPAGAAAARAATASAAATTAASAADAGNVADNGANGEVPAAAAAAPKCLVVAVTLPGLDTQDQRLRASAKEYEEQQARRYSYLVLTVVINLLAVSGDRPSAVVHA